MDGQKDRTNIFSSSSALALSPGPCYPRVLFALECEEPHQSVPAFANKPLEAISQRHETISSGNYREGSYRVTKRELIRIEGHVPELLVDAAVDDKVDGGVEDEEDVVGRVQVVNVGRCV